MRFFRRGLLFLLPLSILGPSRPAIADEGMWMPQQIPQLAERLKALGYDGDAARFADLTGFPMGAVVALPGCTASFVSSEGLIVTNHHCVTGALQYNSTPQKNLLVDGYLAPTRDQELSVGPGARVWVTTAVTDVTEAIRGKLPKLADAELDRLIDKRVKARVAACEAPGGLRCAVTPFYSGLRYFEIAQMEIQDVRLVYAPAAGIGNFGGETDNWRWPRHTGDWSFYRAYVGPDGKPAAFDRANLPYRPKYHLRISATGTQPGQVVFVAGYPGRTQRHMTYLETEDAMHWSLPRQIRLAEEQIALLTKASHGDRALGIKAAARLRGLNNTLTNQKGTLEGMLKGGGLEKKQQSQQALLAWIGSDPARNHKYGGVLEQLSKLQQEANRTREREAWISSLDGRSAPSGALSAALTAHRLSIERAKKLDLDREEGFQSRDWPRLQEAQERAQRTLDPILDRALLRWSVLHMMELSPEERIAPLDLAIGWKEGMARAEVEAAVDRWLDRLYSGTKLFDQAFRLSLLEMKTKDLLASQDSFVELAAALHPVAEAQRAAARARSGANLRLKPVLMEALVEQAGGLLAPDANSTLRVTYGVVKGVDGPDGIFWKTHTTMRGVEQKHVAGSQEFDAPKPLLEAIQALRSGKATPYADSKLGDVPVDFLSTVDTTGGNSGSPTLDAKGELVGLLFDGTYDSVASNYLYEPKGTRSIHVDSRYLLFVMSEVAQAKHLLEEMAR